MTTVSCCVSLVQRVCSGGKETGSISTTASRPIVIVAMVSSQVQGGRGQQIYYVEKESTHKNRGESSRAEMEEGREMKHVRKEAATLRVSIEDQR